jgi:hypothetical protein
MVKLTKKYLLLSVSVGNFSVNSGQRLDEYCETNLKNKVPRKTEGLSLANRRNIFKKAGREL